ncbi:MAG: tyrosine-protein phosphatase [Novosphingobium sp.]
MLEGANNFRDFGGATAADGRRVCSGMLFRSNTLPVLTPEDCAKLDAVDKLRPSRFGFVRLNATSAHPELVEGAG